MMCCIQAAEKFKTQQTSATIPENKPPVEHMEEEEPEEVGNHFAIYHALS